jgi:hypothetical protein
MYDKTYQQFKSNYKKGELWIYKPGEASNRGNGIKVLKDLPIIEDHIRSEINNG